MKSITVLILFISILSCKQEIRNSNDKKPNVTTESIKSINMKDSIETAIKIPITKEALVLRTDFSDNKKWISICDLIKKPSKDEGFVAYVEFLSDKKFEEIVVNDLIKRIPNNYTHSFIFVIDGITMNNSEFPILCIDVHRNIGRTFRVIPSEVWGVENNLSISNMEFDEFASNVDADGVFRGFK